MRVATASFSLPGRLGRALRCARGLAFVLAASLACPGLAMAQDDGASAPQEAQPVQEATAAADPPGRVGRAAIVTGTVRTLDADGRWTALQRNQPLTTGDQVVTEGGGRAVLQVGSTTVRLGENSGMSFARLDDEKIRLHFDHGSLAVRMHSAEVVGEVSVDTDEGEFTPRHPGHFRFDREPGGTLRAMAWSGDMLMQADDSALPISADQRAEIWQEGDARTTHYRMLAIPSDDFAAWALAEDQAEDHQLADAGPGAAAVPSEMTGAAELGQYGNWAATADYGTVWYPSAMYAGWAPYTYGYWNWVGPWGWTWVDYAPWGFAPFHYGRWVWIGGHWAWCPGHWGPRPVYAPGLVGWVGGAGFVASGRPMVGWVALAPHEPYYPSYPSSPRYWNIVNGNAPTMHRPVPPTVRPRAVPPGPVTYANRAVRGAVAIAPAQALTMRQLSPAQRPPAQARLVEAVVAGNAQMEASPAPPPGRSFSFARPATGAGPGAASARGMATARPVAGPTGAPMSPAAPAAHAAPGGHAAPPAAHGSPGRGGARAAAAGATVLPAGGHPPPSGGRAVVVFSAPTPVPQPVPLVSQTPQPVPLVAQTPQPVPLVSPQAPVPLVSGTPQPVPLVTPPQVRPGAPILLRAPSRGQVTPVDAGSDPGGSGQGPGMGAPPGSMGFSGGHAGGGSIGGGIRGGGR